jgi:arylsulfatase
MKHEISNHWLQATRWRAAAVIVAVLFWSSLAPGAETSDAAPARNFVLITVDTWRGDHFDRNREDNDLTPRLARFASKALTFEDASSVATETSPGIAAILTGIYPLRSGVIDNGATLTKRIPTMASTLAEHGFETAAVVANPVLDARYGFGAGFAHYDLISTTRRHLNGRATHVTEAALKWLEGVPKDRRFFLWLHYMDPHGPYEPPEDLLSAVPLERFGKRRTVPLLAARNNSGFHGIPYYQHGVIENPSSDVRDYLARYAAEVRSMDGGLGSFLESLERLNLLGSTVVIVTSDHGEALEDDHGFYFSHSHELTQDQIHVPLLLRYPGGPEGSVVRRPVSTVDVTPTALGLLGIAPASQLDGGNLLDPDSRSVMAQRALGAIYREGNWKLWWHQKTGLRLFDIGADPGERKDLSGVEVDRAAKMKASMLEALERERLADPLRRAPQSKEQEEMLKALGYL